MTTGKRLFDLVLSLLGLILLSPLFILIALCIKLESPGPVFFRGKRVGREGKLFYMYKFRTMIPDAASRGPGITVRGDSRITGVGHWLRRAKLDELPQLINVIRGEMSLVGPRPEDPRYVALYTPKQRQILSIRPGITSVASLSFKNEAELLRGEDWERLYVEKIMPSKLDIELEYLQRKSLWQDIKIIARTILALLC